MFRLSKNKVFYAIEMPISMHIKRIIIFVKQLKVNVGGIDLGLELRITNRMGWEGLDWHGKSDHKTGHPQQQMVIILPEY